MDTREVVEELVVSGYRDTDVIVRLYDDSDTFAEPYAGRLTEKIETVCKQPFFIEVKEYMLGEVNNECAYFEIASVDENRVDVVAPPAKITCMMGVQYYYIKASNPEESYAGKVTIEVRMLCPEPKDPGNEPELNLAVKAVLDLAFMQYYATNEYLYPDLEIRYDTASPQIQTPIITI